MSSVSSTLDPFASSDPGDDIQLEEFSYIKAHIPRGLTPEPKNFVSAYPSRQLNGDKCYEGTDPKLARESLDPDKALSEWETVAADEEFNDSPQCPPRPLRRRKNMELVFHAQDIIGQSLNKANDSTKLERPGMLGSQALPIQPTNRPPGLVSRMQSFDSASSRYSDLDADGVSEARLSAAKEN